MDKKTLKALRGSIKKWIKIVEGTGIDEGSANCPLCALFNYGVQPCRGCPVYEMTNEPFCKGTPYIQWSRALRRNETNQAETASQKKAARAELKFLQGLLP